MKMLAEAVDGERKFTSRLRAQGKQQGIPRLNIDQDQANSQRHVLDQSWDVSLPEIPQRSRLYHLAPIGIGTPNVESLTSFVTRLAMAHCVKTWTIIKQEIAPLMNESRAKALLDGVEAQSMNGLGSETPRWVSALESLTGRRNLHLLTMLPWRNVLTLDNLMRSKRAWCPDCFADSKDKQEPVHEQPECVNNFETPR
jgi:hypothetical protein